MSRRTRGTSKSQEGWIRDYPAAESIIAGFDRSPMPMTLVDARQLDFPIVYANAAFTALTGYTRSDFIGRNCRFLQGPATDAAAVGKIRNAVTNCEPVSVDILNYRKDGSAFWNALSIAPMLSDDGNPLYFFATQIDASDRHNILSTLQADNLHLKSDVTHMVAELTAALHANRLAMRDKEILLHELHDRMKNNLQIFSALISMQIRDLDDCSAREALIGLERRVNAVGAVHRRLHQPLSVGTLNLADMLEDIIPDAVSAHSGGNVLPQLSLEPVSIDSALAAPLALLLNEIMASSFASINGADPNTIVAVTLTLDNEQAVIALEGADRRHLDQKSGLLPFCESAMSRALIGQLAGNIVSRQIDTKMRIELRIPTDR